MVYFNAAKYSGAAYARFRAGKALEALADTPEGGDRTAAARWALAWFRIIANEKAVADAETNRTAIQLKDVTAPEVCQSASSNDDRLPLTSIALDGDFGETDTPKWRNLRLHVCTRQSPAT
jgi:hypothetical protein